MIFIFKDNQPEELALDDLLVFSSKHPVMQQN